MGRVSDIPVGSPPVPPGRHAAPSGWYADPVDPTRERYWDGWQWSRNTRLREGLPPPAEPPAPTPDYPQVQPPGQQYPSYPPAYPQQPGPPAGYSYGQLPGLRRAATADGVPLAGWWWRVLATVIDGMITSTLVGIIGFPLLRDVADAFSAYLEALMAAQPGSTPPAFDPLQVLGFQGILILTLLDAGVRMLYQVGFLRWRSATPGKLACGLRVVPVDQGRFAGPLGWNTIGIRAGVWVLPNAGSALPFLGVALSLFNLVDALFPLWQPKRQAIHDLAAKTQVVRIR
jgi:uncharacterized RDD family membrane protein YckC